MRSERNEQGRFYFFSYLLRSVKSVKCEAFTSTFIATGMSTSVFLFILTNEALKPSFSILKNPDFVHVFLVSSASFPPARARQHFYDQPY
jgi:hypothetical protein